MTLFCIGDDASLACHVALILQLEENFPGAELTKEGSAKDFMVGVSVDGVEIWTTDTRTSAILAAGTTDAAVAAVRLHLGRQQETEQSLGTSVAELRVSQANLKHAQANGMSDEGHRVGPYLISALAVATTLRILHTQPLRSHT